MESAQGRQNIGSDPYPTFGSSPVTESGGSYTNGEYRVTAECERGYGSVEGAGTYKEGDAVQLTVKPAPGCVFDHFEVKTAGAGKMTGWNGSQQDCPAVTVKTYTEEPLILTNSIDPEDYPDEETGETTDPTVLRKEPPAYAAAPLNEVVSDVCRLLDMDHPVVEYADGFDPDADPVKAAAEYFPETDTLLIRTAYLTEDSISLAQYAAARELCLRWMYRKEGIPWKESEYPDDGFNLFWCETVCADVMATALMNFCFGGMDWDRCGIINKNTDHWCEFDERVDFAMEVLEKKRADGAYQIRLEDVRKCG